MNRVLPLLLLLACKGKDPGPRVPTAPTGPAAAALTLAEVAQVGEPVALDGSGSEGYDFSWTFGDGDQLHTDQAEVQHTWQAPGHFTVTLGVAARDGSTQVVQAPITVVYPIADPLPSGSSALAASEDLLWAVMPDHDQLALIDRATHVPSTIATCGEPRSVAVGGSRVAVACADDEVRLYGTDATFEAAVPMPYGSRPFGVVVDPDGRVFVTLQGTGELAEVDASGVLSRTPVGPDLRGIAWTAEGVLVSRHRSTDAAGEVWRVGEAIEPWTLLPDPGPDSDTDARGVPTYLERIAVRPDGRVAVVGGLKANMARGLVRDGNALTHETAVRSVLRSLRLTTSGGQPGDELAEPHFDDRDRVSAMAFHPRGDWLWVAHHGARMVDLVDAYTMDRVGGFHIEGHGPDGLWLSEDGTELWVLASLSRELIAYDVTDPLALPVELDRVDLSLGRPEPLGEQALLGKQIFHDSSDPRMTPANYISCASCHLDGDQDGRVWDFTDRGEGLRNTIPLQGGPGGPFHWSANFDEIQDFENDIRGPFGGRGFLSDADWATTSDALGAPKAGLSEELDALAAYVATLDAPPRSPYRNPDGTMTADALSGQAIFQMPTVGCADCHPPPTYTDSAMLGPDDPLLHDVGTLLPTSGDRRGGPLTGLDTPSLRGLHDTAPYLHDGRYATIRELLDANTDDQHGVTSVLAPVQIDQLEAFLLSIE